MRKARDVIGLPVISVDTGRQVGSAQDLLLDEEWRIGAVLLAGKMWFSSSAYVEWNDVLALGEDAITIPSEDVLKTADEELSYFSLVGGQKKLKGLPVITVNGQQLGIVEDVYLEEQMGKHVIGYELSEGFITDLREGRKWLPIPESVILGEDAIVVPVRCNEELEEIFVSKEE
ncbi:PRC-barrel domain-containing protein [Paenibacillus thalictri]|uniref:Photosystem reaction center subunit H n=1 Tax=Paenibacillus thalictri TaxID=2527873 RepID=A0A4Q9DWV7_9BACL|nr:PRC-barrel domain-containing protein [Paenibacillus thalictri]TBL81584.1 photosystem reaction center subunit H [Paenibacillus thalictri]